MTAFELTPADRAVTGVTVRPGRLVIRPTALAIAGGLLLALVGALFIVFAVFDSAVPIRLLGLHGLWAVAAGWRCASTRLTAEATGLKVRNHWVTKRMAWTEVRSIDSERVRRRWGYLPYSFLWNGPHEFVVGAVTNPDGDRIACDALTSLPDSAGAVPAETKVATLNRWAREHGVRMDGP